MKSNHWEPFEIERNKVKTKKDHACYFTGVKIFKGYLVESHQVNISLENKRSKQRVYICGKCDECKHLLIVRSNQR